MPGDSRRETRRGEFDLFEGTNYFSFLRVFAGWQEADVVHGCMFVGKSEFGVAEDYVICMQVKKRRILKIPVLESPSFDVD